MLGYPRRAPANYLFDHRMAFLSDTLHRYYVGRLVRELLDEYMKNLFSANDENFGARENRHADKHER